MKNLLLGFLLILTISCQQNAQTLDGLTVLTAEQFSQEISADNVQLLDVRTAKEYDQGHIADAQNIDVLEKAFKEEIQVLDKKKPIYVYCRSGNRSKAAAKILMDAGFENVVDLEGGYKAWKSAKE